MGFHQSIPIGHYNLHLEITIKLRFLLIGLVDTLNWGGILYQSFIKSV